MSVERLSRYDLGQIKKLHDEQDCRSVTREYVDYQLGRIGLRRDASRFEVAERIKELERRIV